MKIIFWGLAEGKPLQPLAGELYYKIWTLSSGVVTDFPLTAYAVSTD